VDALVGRLLSWWWKRLRRTLPVPLAAGRVAAGLEVILAVTRGDCLYCVFTKVLDRE